MADLLSAEANLAAKGRLTPAEIKGGIGAYADTGPFTPPDDQPARRSRKPKEPPAPTAADIVNRANRDRSYWNERDKRMEEDQDVFDLVRKIPDPGQLAIYLNDPKVLVEKLAGMAARRKHRIVVPPKGQPNAAIAQRIENGLRHWRNLVTRQWADALHNPLSYDIARSAFLRGWICGRQLLAPDKPSFVKLEIIDAYHVYPRIFGDQLARVCHIYTTTKGSLNQSFPQAYEQPDPAQEDALVECIAYYENKPPYWCAIVAGGEFVKKPTKLDYFPWVIRIAKGSLSADSIGQTTDLLAAAYVGEGFLQALKGNLDDLNKFVTILANMPARDLNPAKVVYTQDGEPKEIDVNPGKTSVLLVGEDWKKVELGPNMATFIPLVTTLQDRINKGGLPAALFGESTNLESGFMSALLMGAAMDTLDAFVAAIISFYIAVYEKTLTLFKDFMVEPMPIVSTVQSNGAASGPLSPIMALLGIGQAPGVNGKAGLEPGTRAWVDSLAPEDIIANGTYVEVEFQDISPQDRVALGNLAALLTRDKLIDMETARDKYLDLDDPALINDKVLAEQVYLNPKAIEKLTDLALVTLGKLPELAALKAAEQEVKMQQMAQQNAQMQAAMSAQAGGQPTGPPTAAGPPEMTGAVNPTPTDAELLAQLMQQQPPGG